MWSSLFALSTTWLYVFVWALALSGLGWAMAWPVLRLVLSTSPSVHGSRLLAWALLNGLLGHYALVLIAPSLSVALWIGGPVALLGLLALLRTLRRLHQQNSLHWGTRGEWALLALLGLPLAVLILYTPLVAWDARSIWFFHARMIYLAKGLNVQTGLQVPTIRFSHPDYPKMLPVLAANLAFVRGYWNEYLPKAALFLALLPVLGAMAPFASQARGRFFFLLALLLVQGSRLWNGYMDAYLALYLACVLLLWSPPASEQGLHQAFGLTALAALPGLKNEGLLAALSLLGTWLVLTHRRPRAIPPLGPDRHWWTSPAAIVYSLLLAAPTLLWLVYRRLWGLENDLQLGSAISRAYFLQRLHEGAWLQISTALWPYLSTTFLLVLLMLGWLCRSRRRAPLAARWALWTGVVYLLGIFTVYLAAPRTLTWLLPASVRRTTLGMVAAFLVGVYFLADVIENSPENSPFPRRGEGPQRQSRAP